ncbi:MAG: hypothetical protein RIF36_07455 [Imperialibacter sp.]|uniref:hypothetical protein n=1 Tax=Imperialibacter sp. TaxID=2038411 RepID=UPI0032EBC305
MLRHQPIVFLLLMPIFGQAQNDTLPLIKPLEIFEKVREFRSNEDYVGAVELLKHIPENDTSYFLAQAELLVTYGAANDINPAKALGARLTATNNEYNATNFLEWGNAWLNAGDAEKGVDIYKKGLSRYPTHHMMHNNIGVAYFRLGQYALAEDHLKECLSVSPFYSNAHIMLARIMILKGLRTKAMLSLMTYLAINPDDNSALVMLENLVNGANRLEGTLAAHEINNDFYYIELLLRSKAPLDERFKTSVDFNASLVKYSTMLLENLIYNSESEDFWMRFYVPFYLKLHKQGLSTFFIYKLLSSTKNEKVSMWLKSHQKENDAYVDLANKELGSAKFSKKITLLGETKMFPVWYYGNGRVNAFGEQVDDDTRVGPWVIYYDNWEKSSIGKYSEDGKKIGDWFFYHKNGELLRKEVYDENGRVIENVVYYDNEGRLSTEAPFSDGKLNGELTYYMACGQVSEIQPYENGANTGQGVVYYSSGQKYSAMQSQDGSLEGTYDYYYKSGNLKTSYTYANNLRHGPFSSFHQNGSKDEHGAFFEGNETGDWKGFHDNGELRYEGAFLDGNRTGEWKFYNQDGLLTEIEQYDQEGNSHGNYKFFDKKGRLYGEVVYSKDRVVEYTYYDSEGVVIAHEADVSGNLPYKSYNALRHVLAEGTLTSGKLNGPLIYRHYNGKLSQQGKAVDNSWDGEFKSFYENGQVREHNTYSDKTANGYYREYYINGKVKSEGWQQDDMPVQTWHYYYPDGTLERESYYLKGELHGPVREYDFKGRSFSEYTYDQGILEKIVLYDTLGSPFYNTHLKNGSGTYELQYISGKIRQKSESVCGEYTTDVFVYASDGRVTTKIPIKNAEYNGTYEFFGSEGKLKVTGNYLNNKQSGLWTWYDDKGSVSSTTEFLNGLRNGKSIHYYENGKVESECSYKNGVREGSCHYYSMNGTLQVEKVYDNDHVVGYRHLLPDGNISQIFPFDPSGDFTLKAYFPNKELSCLQEYKDGLIHGSLKYYETNGTVQEEGHYSHGELSGPYRHFLANGQLSSESHYKYDELEGVQKFFFPNGKLRKVVNWHMGKQNGEEIVFSADGKVKKRNYYWNDELYQ